MTQASCHYAIVGRSEGCTQFIHLWFWVWIIHWSKKKWQFIFIFSPLGFFTFTLHIFVSGEHYSTWAHHLRHSISCDVKCWHHMLYCVFVIISWVLVTAISQTSWSMVGLGIWLALTLVMLLDLLHRFVQIIYFFNLTLVLLIFMIFELLFH